MNKTLIKEWGLMLAQLILGCAIFALGFDLFLVPHSINAGGLSGLAQIVVRLTGLGTVGLWTLLANIPLFLLGGMKIGRRFFVGSLVGAVAMSLLIDLFALLPTVPSEPLLGSVYGGLLTGAGMGLVYLSGASSGGSDIVVRLLKLRFRNAPIGAISFTFDAVVVLLTGITFRSVANVLYCGAVLYVATVVMDAVIYKFDYSKVAVI
ncbi:MAG: YitT family protein, partial [Oscillospiraceae bacterium]|nr:YitT family protein [Oscillospiraceae bacterium]